MQDKHEDYKAEAEFQSGLHEHALLEHQNKCDEANRLRAALEDLLIAIQTGSPDSISRACDKARATL